MKKSLVVLLSSLVLSPVAFADDSVEHSGQASKHSVLASAEGIASTATVASAVAVAPVVLTVGASMAVAAAGDAIHDSLEGSNQPRPLTVTERVITVDAPPNVVINQTIVTQGEK